MRNKKYSNNAAALTWSPINGVSDIGDWTLSISIDAEIKDYKGKGFEEFFILINDVFEKDLTNVVFIKDIMFFIYLLEPRIDMNDIEFLANPDSDGGYDFLRFFFNNVELRNWNSFFKDIKDNHEFLTVIDRCREIFKGKRKNPLSLESHFRFTYANEAWDFIKEKFFLLAKTKMECFKLCPNSIEELERLESLNKSSYYYVNDKFVNEVINVNSWDISSSHIGFLARKKFPYNAFKETKDKEQILEVINNDDYCWCGTVVFYGLKWKTSFRADISKFNYYYDEENNRVFMDLTNLDMKYFDKIFEWDKKGFASFYYAEQRYLDESNYLEMIDWLYKAKEIAKEHKKKDSKMGNLSCQVYKPMTEFPYGQSIKKTYYDQKVVYNNEHQLFEIINNEELNQTEFEKIQYKLKNKRGLPLQWGLWIVAYSRLEMIEMMDRIGFDNVVYADTDCIKFIGEEGNQIMIDRNKEIDEEFKGTIKRKKIKMPETLGRWKFEGHYPRFKTIGVKQYILENENLEVEVVCTGAEKENLTYYFNRVSDPFNQFTKKMKVPNIYVMKKKLPKNCIEFGYWSKIPENILKTLKPHLTTLKTEEET